MPTVPAPAIYRINDVELDTTRGCLCRNGKEIHLKPKAFQIVVHLLTNRDRLVTKEELLDLFWKDTAVSDDVLAHSIAELRRAFGDSFRDPIYLKTIPRRGYRFVGAVQEIHAGELISTEHITTVQVREEYSDETPRRHLKWWLLIALVCALSAASVAVWRYFHPGLPPPVGGKRQVAVLRFENRSGQRDLDWLRDGLPDMLTTTLSRSTTLDVLSREQISLWLGSIGENGLNGAVKLARRSHARIAVVGSFVRIGGNIRIETQIYDGWTSSLLAAESISVEKPEQILTEVDSLAFRLASRLAATAPAEDRRALSSLMTDNLEAYRYYTLGLEKAEALQTREAIELFEKAVALDPNFAMAYARLGYAYAVTAARVAEGKPYLEKAFQMAGKLTEKDRRHIVAWYAIANQDYQEAIRRYGELIAAYPNESEACYRLGYLLRGESRHEQAVEVLRKALAIDPDEPKIWNALAAVYSEMGRHPEAIEMAKRYLSLSPTDANAYDTMGLAYQFAGFHERAMEAYSRAVSLKPDFEISRIHRGIAFAEMGQYSKAMNVFLAGAAQSGVDRPRYRACAAWLYWRRGRVREARAMLREADEGGAESSLRWSPAGLTISPRSQVARRNLTPISGRGGRFGLRFQFFYLAQEARLRNQPDEMLANLREALHYRPPWGGSELLEDALADGYLELGRLNEAIAEYQRTLKLFPGMALARYHLAQAWHRKGNNAEARTHFRQFLELWKQADPDLPEIAEARRRAL